jgi:hypothetical protein
VDWKIELNQKGGKMQLRELIEKEEIIVAPVHMM